MRRSIFAACVAASAILGASAAAQPPAGEQQGSTAEATATEVERLRREAERLRNEAEQARERLEAAARELASRAVPARPITSVYVAGGPTRARLGVALVDAEGGALVTEVVPGSGAADAGIEVGDLIQSIDGAALAAASSPSAEILDRLGDVEREDSVTLAVERAGDVLEYDVDVTDTSPWTFAAAAPFQSRVVVLDGAGEYRVGGALSEGTEPSSGAVVLGSPAYGIHVLAPQRLRPLTLAASNWGEMELVPMTSGLGRYFGTDEGLLVIHAPSDESIGIEEGDVILTIGGRTPSSPEHAIRILASFEPGETIEFSIMRERTRQTVQYAVP